jgi:acetyl-CoA carboxylase biotin carboxyl carrier protein
MNEKFILTLLDKFSTAGAAELDLQDDSFHIILRKDGVSHNAADTSSGAAADTVPVRLGLPVSAPGSAADASGGETITSPIVATFYASPGPDAPAFVKPGARVKAGNSLCILEAMKMMNHLEAEFDCEILSVKAASGDLVEYGQVLFEVKRL